jgi:hypothetical protein
VSPYLPGSSEACFTGASGRRVGSKAFMTHMSRRNTFPSMPFIFSGLAFVMLFATAASSLTARSASRSYPSRLSFIFCMERHAHAGSEATHAYLSHLAYLLRDLGRGLQVLSDHRDRLHDRAEDIERRDGVIEGSHACEGRLMFKTAISNSVKRAGSRRKTLDRCSTSWAEGKSRNPGRTALELDGTGIVRTRVRVRQATCRYSPALTSKAMR